MRDFRPLGWTTEQAGRPAPPCRAARRRHGRSSLSGIARTSRPGVAQLRPVCAGFAGAGTRRQEQRHMHLTGEIGDRVAPRTVRRIGSTGLVALLAAALAGGTLGGSPSTAATTPGAPAMPSALKPGTETAPVFPMRTVPGFAGPLHADARVRDGDGGTDQRFNVPTPAGSTLLWGDWNRDGAVTPIVFTSGHWVCTTRWSARRRRPRASSTTAWPATSRSWATSTATAAPTSVSSAATSGCCAPSRPPGRPGAGSGSARPPTSRSPVTGTATAGTVSGCAEAPSTTCSSRPRARSARRCRRTPSRSVVARTPP